jgi:hypothetical protein
MDIAIMTEPSDTFKSESQDTHARLLGLTAQWYPLSHLMSQNHNGT